MPGAKLDIGTFFQEEFPDFAIYNLYRMVASYVDGLKPSQRKIVYTAMKDNIKNPMKVSQMGNRVANLTQYMHGEDNLAGVIVSMAQDFCGTNNINLLYPESSFGNRCIPEAAAARYIYTRMNDCFSSIFKTEDNDLLTEQEFEGDPIEPAFFLPTIPLILINGSTGIGSGWSQKILPRNPAEVKKAVVEYLKNGKLPARINPWYRGFNGTVNNLEGNRWEICGVIERVNTTTIRITELPIGINLDRYNKILFDLEEKGVIEDFDDNSEPGQNKFLFDVKVTRAWMAARTDRQIIEALKLNSTVTENFTCMDENNIVREFKSEIEILQAYCDFRLPYYEARRKKMISDLDEKIMMDLFKRRFITNVIEGKIDVKGLKKSELIKVLKDDGFAEADGNFDYLIRIPIYQLTIDEVEALDKKIEKLKHEKHLLEKTTSGDLWKKDLEKV